MVADDIDTVEIYVEVKKETEQGEDNFGAIFCTDGYNEFWLPK